MFQDFNLNYTPNIMPKSNETTDTDLKVIERLLYLGWKRIATLHRRENW